MLKPIAKKIILQFKHNQEKRWFFECKTIENYDIGTVVVKSVIADNINQAVEKLKLYWSDLFEINQNNFIIRLEPKSDNKK